LGCGCAALFSSVVEKANSETLKTEMLKSAGEKQKLKIRVHPKFRSSNRAKQSLTTYLFIRG